MVTLVAYAARLGFGQINERTDCCLHNPPRKSYANPPKQPHAVATVVSVGIDHMTVVANIAKANWYFTTTNARIKLKHLYPPI